MHTPGPRARDTSPICLSRGKAALSGPPTPHTPIHHLTLATNTTTPAGNSAVMAAHPTASPDGRAGICDSISTTPNASTPALAYRCRRRAGPFALASAI